MEKMHLKVLGIVPSAPFFFGFSTKIIIGPLFTHPSNWAMIEA
jgi:hypothetical protein